MSPSVRSAPLDPATVRALDAATGVGTPERVLLPQVLRDRIGAFQAIAADLSARTGLRATMAYSVKTNTDKRILELIAAGGFDAEVISQPELVRAARCGFAPARTILNGPGKWWRSAGAIVVGTVYADSVTDMRRILDMATRGKLALGTIGIRVAPQTVPSRFGIDLRDEVDFGDLVALLRDHPQGEIAVHFHYAPMVLGVTAWEHEVAAVAVSARRLAAEAGTKITRIDVGGGWSASALTTGFASSALRVMARLRVELPTLTEVVFEPGRALVEPSMVLLTRVLAIRGRGSARAAVVDGSIAELPDETTRSRQALWRDPGIGAWRYLQDGRSAIYGRLCMEADIPAANVEIPPNLREGDHLALLDAGGYDHSMSYSFGQ